MALDKRPLQLFFIHYIFYEDAELLIIMIIIIC